MKHLKYLLIIFLAFFIVGCQNITKQTNANVNKPTYYERLETEQRKKINFNFEAVADLDKIKKELDHKPHLQINAEIENKGKIPVRFDLAHFQIVNETTHPNKTNVITIKPNKTKKVTAMFKDINITPQISKLTISYFAGKFELGNITKIKNQAELDEIILSENHETDNDTNKMTKLSNKNYTDSQIIAWIGNVLSKLSSGHLTRDDYLYRVSDLGGIKIFIIQENHQSENMKSRGADPNTSPIVYQLFLNDEGQLEDYNTHEIFSEAYPG